MDSHIYTTKGPQPKTVLWRPKTSRSIALSGDSYRPFSQVVRTVHLDEALNICVHHCIKPRPVTSLSSLRYQMLRDNHPLKHLHVLWFGAKLDVTDEDTHDWYGNVEFALPMDTLMHRWKNFYMVEMVTAPTHSLTRILATNSNYSYILPRYNPHKYGGGWHITPDGRHERLIDCRRYNNEGYNRHGHTLEFMIEVTDVGMKKILHETEISFKNHKDAVLDLPHVCHRFKGPHNCPTPLSRASTSKRFFHEHCRLNTRLPMATPKLSPSAEKFLDCFHKMGDIPRPLLTPQPMPSPYLSCCPPPITDQHFPPLPSPDPAAFIISHFLQQHMANGKIMKRHHLLGKEQNSVFRLIAESITKAKKHPDDEEDEKMVAAILMNQRPYPKLPSVPSPDFLLAPHLYPPPGFLPRTPPPSFGIPPPHLPPPPTCYPPPASLFPHSWAPLQPIQFRRRN